MSLLAHRELIEEPTFMVVDFAIESATLHREVAKMVIDPALILEESGRRLKILQGATTAAGRDVGHTLGLVDFAITDGPTPFIEVNVTI